MNHIVRYSEHIYNALLSLYPVRFRVRFGPEMAQLFRDCCHDALQKGEVAVLVAFLLQVTRDLLSSILRERSREIFRPPIMTVAEHPVIAMIDSLLIPSIVTANLMVLGPILTLLVQGVPALHAPIEQFMVTSGFFSFAIGSLAVGVSLVLAKLRPTVRLWVKLSA
jgi:hypothetical protein